MATTPPPSRQRTPPTPLHGAKYDIHEPYSPRRSTRISKSVSKRAVSPPQLLIKPTHAAGHSTPRRHSPRHAPSIDFSLSPPSSPAMSDKQSNTTVRHPISMLPTPAKTPRKRAISGGANLEATARVLFPSSRPVNVDDVMPTPRRSRKGRKHTAFTLSSLAEEEAEEAGIAIFTDSVDRIPEVDEAEDNPFLVKHAGRGSRASRAQGASQSSAPKTKYGISKEVDDAVDRGEGIVYVFRGKKIFRKFDDAEIQDQASGESEDLSDQEVRRQVGRTSKSRLARSSIKPRLLFPPKEPSPAPDDVDEDALTDIEGPIPETASESEDLIKTPVKQQRFSGALTPPTTGRRTRSAYSPPMVTGPKRATPFDSWQRTKPVLGGASATKRPGEVMEGGRSGHGKRTRSGEFVFG